MNLINLKLAVRNLGRNKLYTFINISGLSIACAFCILTFWYVKSEQSFDNFHKDQDRLFRVEQSNFFASSEPVKKENSFLGLLTKDDEEKNLLQTPLALAGDIKAALPQIQDAVRIKAWSNVIVRVNNESFREGDKNFALVDPRFIAVLNYPLLYGNANTALASQNSVIISERTAKKYFGYSNPIGRTLNIPVLKGLFTITAVTKNFPTNSSFQFDVIVPRTADPSYLKYMQPGNGDFNDLLIIKTKEGVDLPRFKQALLNFSKNYYAKRVQLIHKFDSQSTLKSINIFIRPLADAHYNQSTGWGHYTNLKNIYQFIFLSVVILLIAGLNYILLTLTSTISRSQDVGVRKTIGANKLQVIMQYYTETQLLTFLAVSFGVVLSVIFLPVFNNLTGSNININNISFREASVYLLILACVLGILAGIYPALIMSGLKPLSIMRGFSAYRINPFLSRLMTSIQFCICIGLIISVLLIQRQMKFINSANLGFDTDQVIVIQNPYDWNDKEKSFALQDRIYHYATTQSALGGATATNFNGASNNTRTHVINGNPETIEEIPVDYNFFAFNKIPILRGRNFSTQIPTDSAEIKLTEQQQIKNSSAVGQAVIINQTLDNMLGHPAIGSISPELGAVIIGVCKDYHTDDLTKKIMPAYHNISVYPASTYWIKIKAGQNVAKALNNIHQNWNKITDNSPFTYSFMDDNVKKAYDVYMRLTDTIDYACFLAIFIACLGLFGLSGITTINRTKEIGIRKILGASTSNLFVMINQSTFILALCAFVVAAPAALYLVNQWLDNFAYRIYADWSVFALSAFFTVLTAIIAVSYHTIKAVIANPVKSLRSE